MICFFNCCLLFPFDLILLISLDPVNVLKDTLCPGSFIFYRRMGLSFYQHQRTRISFSLILFVSSCGNSCKQLLIASFHFLMCRDSALFLDVNVLQHGVELS